MREVVYSLRSSRGDKKKRKARKKFGKSANAASGGFTCGSLRVDWLRRAGERQSFCHTPHGTFRQNLETFAFQKINNIPRKNISSPLACTQGCQVCQFFLQTDVQIVILITFWNRDPSIQLQTCSSPRLTSGKSTTQTHASQTRAQVMRRRCHQLHAHARCPRARPHTPASLDAQLVYAHVVIFEMAG